jgi:hypothetical protein
MLGCSCTFIRAGARTCGRNATDFRETSIEKNTEYSKISVDFQDGICPQFFAKAKAAGKKT